HFNMEWLIGLNLFFGLPWILGMGLGEIARVNGITNLKKFKGLAKLMKWRSRPKPSHPSGPNDLGDESRSAETADPGPSTPPQTKKRPHGRKRRGW
ncbi:MAG: hypothetical protein V2B18_24625, partial [Pseudomonadota bacterium]